MTDGNGRLTTYAWDVSDRLVRVEHADGLVVSSAYDKVGNQVAQTDAQGTVTSSYDPLNRLVSQVLPDGDGDTGETLSYAFDATGNLSSYSDRSGTVAYRYDATNQTSQVTLPDGSRVALTHDDDGNRVRTAYPNGVVQDETWDAAGRLLEISGTGPDGQTLTRFAYDHTDPATGQDTALRHGVTDAWGNTTRYGYDALSRLTSAETTPGGDAPPGRAHAESFAYGYDAASNRVSETVDGVSVDAVFNAANQLVRRGDVTYSYDAAGNTTGDSAGRSFSYNTANQTVAVGPGDGDVVTMGYRGSTQVDRTVASTGDGAATGFTTAATGVTRAGSTAVVRDTLGRIIALDGAQGTHYPPTDALGSVAALTDNAGDAVNRYRYDPWGVALDVEETVANPWRYVGQHQDPTGLYKIGHRYYDPQIGRWTQQDPIESNLANLAENNRYAYVGCNPTNLTDPTGLATCAQVVGVIYDLAGIFACAYICAVLVAAPPAAIACAIVCGLAYLYSRAEVINRTCVV